jgi:hypothetical protein
MLGGKPLLGPHLLGLSRWLAVALCADPLDGRRSWHSPQAAPGPGSFKGVYILCQHVTSLKVDWSEFCHPWKGHRY